MAQERALTPEKQLLNLIESPKANEAVIRSQAVKHHNMQLLSPGAWRSKLSFFSDNFKKGISGRFHQPDIKVINKLLAVIIVAVIFYLMNTFYFSIMNLKRIPGMKLTSQEGNKTAVAKDVQILKQTAAYYVEQIRKRDIFKIGPKTVSKETAPAAPPSALIEATQHLKLVGISWSRDPDAMIEDSRALRTFFVKRGQMIGRVKIEAIFKDKVVISYDGEEVELR